MAIPPNTSGSLAPRPALAALLFLAACSVLPERAWPPRLLGEIEAVYHIAPGGERLVPVPLSDERITLYDLHAHTAGVEERWLGGRRYWVVPDGLAELRIHCRYRAFGTPGEDPFASALGPQELFPGALIVRHDASPQPVTER
ncbi:MAG: hypothetical protein IT457_10435 [Planctomycetes bacterium]|nr:hypothetical protein [Planctomycetota bacterium]